MPLVEKELDSECYIGDERLINLIDEAVVSLCKELRDEGKQCFLVGGATRDLLMGQKPKDWDLTTDATPEEMMKIFKNERVVPSGIKHGTITVIKDNEPYEITTFRTEGRYSDGRRPDYVAFTPSLEEDLKRRDLTINAIAYDPIGHKIVTTPNDGIHDLRNRVIKAVGDPGERFREDGLRPMRVCRFASRLNFDVSDATLKAIEENVDVIDNISSERIRDELIGILKSDKPSVGLECLRSTGLLKKVLPELDDLYGLEQTPQYHKYDVYWHTLHGLDSIPKENLAARVAFLFHDTGKKPARAWSERKQRYAFSGHEELSATLTEEIMTRLKFSKAEIDKAKAIVANHMMHDTSEWSDKAVRKLVNRVGEENVEDLLIMHEGDLRGKGRDITKELDNLKNLRERLKRLKEETGKAGFTSRDLAITGYDVMEYLDLSPSPEVGKAINHLTEKVMEDPSLNTKESLYALMNQMKCRKDTHVFLNV